MDQEGRLKWSVLISTLRTLLGWSQAELAAAAGFHATTIAKQEEEANAPSVESRKIIEAALGIEGQSQEVEAFLGDLSQRMLGVRGANGEAWGIQSTVSEAARFMQSALWLGLQQMREGDAEEPLSWGRLIATLRALRGWNQKELGQVAGVDTRTISRHELGEREPSRIVKEKLEETLLGASGLTSEVVQIHLGGLKAMMTSPKVGTVMASIREAGEITSQFVEETLRGGREEILGVRAEHLDADPAGNPGL
jgi:transcriptional regulator with XRE-family HTH domain